VLFLTISEGTRGRNAVSEISGSEDNEALFGHRHSNFVIQYDCLPCRGNTFYAWMLSRLRISNQVGNNEMLRKDKSSRIFILGL
jgi:hypothetical protein